MPLGRLDPIQMTELQKIDFFRTGDIFIGAGKDPSILNPISIW